MATTETTPNVPAKHHGNASDHLANERTYLAWLRTAVSLLSFGISLNRFSIYLQQSDRLEIQPHHTNMLVDSANVGIGMVILGVLVMLGAAVRYNVTMRQIIRGDVQPQPVLIWLITIAALLLAGVSLAFLFRT